MSAPAEPTSAPLLTTPLKNTPLNALHIELGARMVPFAGYSMPVQYPAGLMAEHHHTRNAAGLFDVSHMGQLHLVGPDAAAAFETLMPVDVIDLPVGKQRYGLLLTDEGTIIDDLMFFNKGNGEIVIRPVDDLLRKYAESHQHPTNEVIHFVCVPVIMWTVLGLIWALHPLLALLAASLALVYYVSLSASFAVGMALMAAASAPSGSPPPLGAMQFQKNVWFQICAALL